MQQTPSGEPDEFTDLTVEFVKKTSETPVGVVVTIIPDGEQPPEVTNVIVEACGEPGQCMAIIGSFISTHLTIG